MDRQQVSEPFCDHHCAPVMFVKDWWLFSYCFDICVAILVRPDAHSHFIKTYPFVGIGIKIHPLHGSKPNHKGVLFV